RHARSLRRGQRIAHARRFVVDHLPRKAFAPGLPKASTISFATGLPYASFRSPHSFLPTALRYGCFGSTPPWTVDSVVISMLDRFFIVEFPFRAELFAYRSDPRLHDRQSSAHAITARAQLTAAWRCDRLLESSSLSGTPPPSARRLL